MAPEPMVKPLSHSNRVWTFRLLVIVFCVAMPVFIFYAIGYRIDFDNDRNIITVGGLYISAEAEDVSMFVDELPVVNMRIFQQAAYIQNLDAGIHRVHVERDGLQTWVKELPVYPHIVTEAEAFNLPQVAQVRFIPEWLTTNDIPVYITDTITKPLFPDVALTNAVVATTSPITRGYVSNTEYEYVTSLFSATNIPASSARRAVDIFQPDFSFDTTQDENASTTATTTKEFRDVRLYENGGDVFATWRGPARNIPFYYCVTYTSPATTTREYGEHVYESLIEQFRDTYDLADPLLAGKRLCRDTIRIDRSGQTVHWFDFVPGNTNQVLMLLDEGLYVVEIDDRSWQNVQLLYPGSDLEARVDGGRIYIFDRDEYFEVIPGIAS